MSTPDCYPFRSSEARTEYLKYYDALAARKWPLVSEERVVETPHGDTFVRISGPADAPPLVLLPGAAATSLMWVANIQALSEEYRTYAVDRVDEIGRSMCRQPVGTMDSLLAWLNELFDGLGFRDGINLAGMSYGGALTAQCALHFPARLNKVILLAPGNTILPSTAGFYFRVILMALSKKQFLPMFARWIFADMARKDPQWLEGIIEELLVNMQALRPRRVVIPPVLTDAEWGTLRTPALFLVGENERIYSTTKVVRRLKRVAPQVKVEVIPDAGHDLIFVQRAMVNRAMLDFLR